MQTNIFFSDNILFVHPRLGDGEVRRKADDVRAGRFTSGALCLYCELESRLTEHSVIDAVCYSEDWQLMAEGKCVHPRGRDAHRRVGVTLRSERIWMEGMYRVLLSHGGEPFAVAEFQYDGKASMPCKVRSIGDSDVEYQLLTRVASDDELRWYDVHRFDGMGEVKLDLVRHFCRRDFDALCQEYGMSLRGVHRYAVITAPTMCSAYRLAEVLPRYLHFSLSKVDLISCNRYTAEDINGAFSFVYIEDKAMGLTDIGALPHLLGCRPRFRARALPRGGALQASRYPYRLPQGDQGLLHEAERRWQDRSRHGRTLPQDWRDHRWFRA